MKYIYIKKEYIDSLKKLLKDLGPEFVSLRKSRKNNPIEKYFTDTTLRLIVAIDGSKVVGYKAYKIMSDSRCKSLGMGVAKKYRRKGIIYKLYRLQIADLKKRHINEIITRTWSTNNKSIPLFEKLGFKKYRTIKNTRVNGADSVWYRLKL